MRWILFWRSADEEFAVLDAAGERLAGDDVATQNALCQQRLHRVLHVTAQRTRAKLRIVGRVDDELLGLGRQLAVELLVLEPFVQGGDLQVDDAGDVLLRQRLVEDDLVEPVQEFGRNDRRSCARTSILRRFDDLAVLVDAVQQRLRAEIARVRIRIVFLKSTVRPCESVMRPSSSTCSRMLNTSGCAFFNLVEQDDAVRAAADGLGQLAAFFIADVSGRRTDQTRHGELLHVFGHIDADEVLLVVEERLGQRLGQLGLADARRAEEGNEPIGRFGS